jgi:putative transcriptional regulator
MNTQSTIKVSLEGQLLVATPFVQEAPYHRAVVYLLQHNDRGSVGLVLNNALPIGLAKLGEHVQAEQLVRSRLKPSEPQMRLILGCLLWPPGQLQQELDSGVWLTSPAQLNAQTVQDDLWSGLLRQIGQSLLRDTLHLKGFPADPRLN